MRISLTREAFLLEVSLLREKGYEPRLEPDGMIVILSPSGHYHCVVTAVVEMVQGEIFAVDELHEAGRRIGLRPYLRERIAEANDYPDHDIWHPRGQLRRRLLDSLRLVAPISHTR
jgi:hypothetical protein